MFDRKFRLPAFAAWLIALSLGLGLAGTRANAQVADKNADWQARSAAAGVFYKNNFDFPDTQSMIQSSYSGFNWPERAQLETVNKLSGRGAFRASIPNTSDESTVAYRHSFDGVGAQTKNVKKKAFYYQFAIYLPRYILEHRFATLNNLEDTRHKFAIIMEPDLSFDSGEVVITNARFRRFVTAYRIGASGNSSDFVTSVSNTACTGGSPNYRWQNAIDGGQSDTSTCAAYKRRYGPVHYNFTGINSYGTTLVPDPDAAVSGATWAPDAWNVVEVFIDYDTQTFKMWHAVYGETPKLVMNYAGNADLGNRAGNYSGVQLVPRLEELIPDPTRQNTYAIYGEIIASDQAINFPGGFAPGSSSGGGGGTPSPTPTPTAAGAAPSWVTGMPVGTWSAIGTNTIGSLNPQDDPNANPNYPNSPPWIGMTGQASVTQTWNGGALATGYPAGGKGSLIVWGGGHRDYYGNELYAFDLSTQRWARLTNPYKNTVFPVTDGVWPDGTPSVPHTYGFSGYHPSSNSFACMYTQSSNSPANATVPVFFDFDTMKWRRGPKNSSEVQYGGWAVYDSSRDAWWAEGGDSGGVLAKYTMNGDGSAGAWTNYSAKFNALDSRAARDPLHDILVITTFRQDDNMYGVDLKNPSGAPVRLVQGGSAPARDGAAGWEWSEWLQAFVYWRSGGGVYKVAPPSGDWRTGTWTWTALTGSANAMTPQDPSGGIYNRFRLMRYSDAEIAVVVNSVDGKVYAFRMPGTGAVVKTPNPPSTVTAE